MLNAAGSDYLEDFDCLREDRGLAAMREHAIPSPAAARRFLYQFHDAEKIELAQQDSPMSEVSYGPEDSRAVRGLAQANQDVVRELARRCAGAAGDRRYGCHRDRELEARGQGNLSEVHRGSESADVESPIDRCAPDTPTCLIGRLAPEVPTREVSQIRLIRPAPEDERSTRKPSRWAQRDPEQRSTRRATLAPCSRPPTIPP